MRLWSKFQLLQLITLCDEWLQAALLLMSCMNVIILGFWRICVKADLATDDISSCCECAQMYGKPAAFDLEAGAGPGISTQLLAPASSSQRISASDSDYEDALVGLISTNSSLNMFARYQRFSLSNAN